MVTRTDPGFRRFELCQKAGFRNLCNIHFAQQWLPGDKLIVTIPAFVPARDIIAPPGTTGLKLQCLLLQADTASGEVSVQQTRDIDFRYDDDPVATQEINFPWQAAAGSISLLAFSLQYFRQRMPVTVEKYYPAMVWEGWG